MDTPAHLVQSSARKILVSERAAFLGKTGSGKTWLARSLSASVNRLVVCDPKGKISPQEWGITHRGQRGLDRLAKGKPARVLLNEFNGPDDWERWLELLYTLRGVIVYIDELYAVGPALGSPALRALYTRGRELEIGVWAASQRPAMIPLFTLSEVEWLFQFQLRMPADIERMVELIGPLGAYPLRGHSFIRYNDVLGAKLYRRAEIRNGTIVP